MKITYEDNGIRIRKLFKVREVSYNDIQSVVLSNEVYIFTTNEGEVICSKAHFLSNYTVLYDAFKKYNIRFKNEDELKKTDNVYSTDEVNEMIAQMKTVIEEYATNLIHEKAGSEYDIDVRIIEEGEWINMYFRLLKNGELVTDIPEEAKRDSVAIEPYAFDSCVLAFLLEWDGCGWYGVTNEMKKREGCETYLAQSLNHLFMHYKTH